MFDKLFKDTKTRGRNLILCVLPFVLLIGFFGYFAYKSISSIIPVEEPTEIIDEGDVSMIGDMHYKLRQNATDYQIELFNQLDEAADQGDDLRTAQLVAMNFVADFYTWTNKSGSFDVGGIYFVNGSQRKSIALDARMHFYKYLTYYINEYGNEALPEVTHVEVVESSESDTPYEFDGKLYDSYYVKLDWKYNDYTFDNHLGTNEDGSDKEFMTRGYFNVIKRDNGRFEIVDAWGDE